MGLKSQVSRQYTLDGINVLNKNKYATNSWSDLLSRNEQIIIIDKLIELSKTRPWLKAGDYPETTN